MLIILLTYAFQMVNVSPSMVLAVFSIPFTSLALQNVFPVPKLTENLTLVFQLVDNCCLIISIFHNGCQVQDW